MDGAQHLQGGEVGKLTAQKIECIKEKKLLDNHMEDSQASLYEN